MNIFWYSFILLASGVALGASAQDSSYHADINRKTIFFEDFNNSNASNWNSGHNCYYGKVENGYYVYEVKKKQSYVRLFDVDIDKDKDFEIEFVVNVPDRKGWYSYAVFSWDRQRGKKIGNCYSLTVRENGSLFVTYGDPEAEQRKQLYHAMLNIKVNDYNKYTIRRKGNSYLLYVNERFVGSFPYTPIRNKTMGLGAGAHNRLGMAIYDHVRVSYAE